jgi:hypothetical protein
MRLQEVTVTRGTLQPLVMEEVSDPPEVWKFRVRREKFDRNFDWFRTHTSEVYDHHRGI